MATDTQTLEGRFTDDGAYSVFGFRVVCDGTSTLHGSLDAVEASLTAGPDGLFLEGTARTDSISIRGPDDLRTRIEERLGHPEITFASTGVELGEDGVAHVEGELTLAGTTRAVRANGPWRAALDGSLAQVAIGLDTRIDDCDDPLVSEIDVDVQLVLVRHDLAEVSAAAA